MKFLAAYLTLAILAVLYIAAPDFRADLATCEATHSEATCIAELKP